MRSTLFAALLLVLGYSLVGQSLTGTITDQRTGAPVANATIFVKEARIGVVTNDEGIFQITFPASGNYALEISHVSYETIIKKVYVDNTTTDLGSISLQLVNYILNSGVVVTAQRDARSQFDVPEAVTLITQRDIIENAYRTAPEALIGATGVWVQKTNHGSGSPFVRGLTGNQTLLMLDGIRMNNSTYRYGPNQYFVLVNPLNIEQIEVVRGAGSVLYGSDALGGTIQVFTRNPQFSANKFRFGGAAYAKYLSDDMEKSGRGELKLSGNKVAILAGFDYKDFGDLVAGKDLGKEAPSAYNEMAGDLKSVFKLGGKGLLTLAYNGVFQSDVGRYDQVAQRGYAFWQFNPQNRQMAYARLQFANADHKWLNEWKVTASWQNLLEGREFRRNDSTVQTEEEDEVNTIGVIGEVISQPGERWRIVSGVEFYNDRVNSQAQNRDIETGVITPRRGLYPEEDTYTDNLAIFTSHTLDFSKLSLNLGARFNYFSLRIQDATFGNTEINPTALVGNASVCYALTSAQALTASVNTGFRAPNVNDVSTFGSFDFGIETPSTGLKPEKTLTFELGYKIKTPVFAANLAAYRTQLYDLIARVRSTFNGQPTYNGEDVYKKENVSESYLQGVEFDGHIRLNNRLSVFASAAYTYGQNTSADEPMRRIPPFNGRVAFSYRHTGWFGQAEWLYAGEQNRLAGDDKSDHRINPNGTPAWNIFNLKAGYRFNKIELNAGLQNLFNEAYRIHGSGVDGIGRSFWLTGRLEF